MELLVDLVVADLGIQVVVELVDQEIHLPLLHLKEVVEVKDTVRPLHTQQPVVAEQRKQVKMLSLLLLQQVEVALEHHLLYVVVQYLILVVVEEVVKVHTV
tara:strand:- start:111 stop:413 length:303 start_codon:yes stop_codon:yes gene_type:complete